MNDFVLPLRLASQPQALYFRFEKGGLTLDAPAVPWSAEAVIVEALLRIPPSARRRSDFTLQLTGGEISTVESMRPDTDAGRHRLFFRCRVPPTSGRADLFWRKHLLGSLDIPILTPERFLADLRLDLDSAFVALEGRSVAARTFVAKQQRGLAAAAVVRSSTCLIPLLDLGLTAHFRSKPGGAEAAIAVPLTASQLAGREALVAALPPRLPSHQGEWTVTWSCGSRELGVTRLRAVTATVFRQSLRVCDTRFVVLLHGGELRVVRQLPPQGVEQAGPCFLVASREPGMAGYADFEIRVQVPGAGTTPCVLTERVLITDGPTPVAAGLLPMEQLKQASAFELRVGKRVLGVLPLSPIPTATLTAEGGFKSAPEFAWNAAAEEELAERLARLMGAPGSTR